MASIIRVKRSTGNTAPSNLQFGEVALTIGAGVAGNKGERLFVGDDSLNSDVVGGKYYTDLMAHTPGSIAGVANAANAANGFVAIVDQNRKVDEWNVDDLRLDGNTLSSQTTDADIIFNPDGSGDVMIPDDTKLGFGGGSDGASAPDATIEYDENGTDKIQVAGADWVYGNTVALTLLDTTQSNSKDTGSLVTEGGVGIEKNLNVGGNLNVAGVGTFVGGIIIDPNSPLRVGNIGIHSNKIETLAGGGNQLFIDPFPSGLSNEGDVIIKGNLQVDGTTTTVNSTQTTVNDPIMMVGDTTSTRTVMVAVQSGVSTVIVDQVTGIAVNDTLLHSSFSASGITTVTAINSGAKMLTFQGTTIAGISTQTEISVVHATDTNTDRGLGFTYNTGIGTANSTDGFFGLDDSSIASSTAGTGNHGTHGDNSRRWTYVPDATIANSVVSGTKGFLDIKGIYYQSGNFSSGGVVWFDDTGLQRSTNAPQTPVITSKQVLTAITKVTLSSLSAAITVAVGDIVKQDTTGAFGVVETAVTGGNAVNLIGVEGTFNTTNNLRREGQSGAIANLSSVPGAATNVYVNKPHWTSTLDGGTF